MLYYLKITQEKRSMFLKKLCFFRRSMFINEQAAKLIEHYQKALLINPRSSVTYGQLAELYYQQGNLENTLETCQKAIQKHPNSTLILETLTKVSTRLGFDEDETRYLSEALPNMMVEEAIAVLVFQTPKEVKSNHKAETWRDAVILGYKLANQGLWSDAIQSCFTAISLEPGLNFPHFIIQYFILSKVQNPELIANLYFQAIKLPEIHPIAYAVLGDALTKQNKLAEAITAYKNAWLKSSNQTRDEKRLGQERTQIDYLVVGTGKAGTTSLFHYLSQHPQIINPYNKEILFFNEHYGHWFR
ncbi:MAG: tetratricopeptide repeat protein [Leptolyngbyaceae cyanobacterium bins.302]|nr:tetratricopeptide repeat protein [Leptolyngbyaceae cyanobacterium bins.302]